MSVQSEISRLADAKAGLKTAIEAKGVSVPSEANLDSYSELVSQIPAGIESLDANTPTTLNGILKGNGANLGVAVAGVDYVATESDPTVPSWAKQPTKPSYTAAEVGADAAGTASSAVAAHNAAADAHAGLFAARLAISEKGAANGLATLDANGKVTASQTSARIVSVSTNTTLSSSHVGCLIVATGTITITIPNSLAVGTEIEIMNYGTGSITVTAASGVSLNGVAAGSKTIPDQYTSGVLKAITATAWVIQGAIE